MPMSLLLIFFQKVLSCNWLANNNNFSCRQELKIWVSCAIFEQKRISFDNLIHVAFWTKRELFYKNPQITISEPTKSGRQKLIFSRFTQNQLQVSNGTENRLNTLSHRMLGKVSRGTNEIHAFFISNAFSNLASVLLNFLMNWASNAA